MSTRYNKYKRYNTNNKYKRYNTNIACTNTIFFSHFSIQLYGNVLFSHYDETTNTVFLYKYEDNSNANTMQIMTEKIIENDVNKNAIVTNNEIEECSICYENDGIMSFGCCSIKYCSKCINEICKLGKCSQCRRNVNTTDIHKIDFLNNN